MILGIDEVGRGCWAGPLCVGAVVLPDDFDVIGLNDSKLVSAKKRPIIAKRIQQTATGVGIGWASSKYIDTHGLTRALEHATHKAVAQVTASYDEIILDGTVNFLKPRQVTLLKKADQLIPAVSAASIVAKVARDQYMAAMESYFVGYGFAQHVGYGTKIHREALAEFGPTAIHRMSFAPLAGMLPKIIDLETKDTAGAIAENAASRYLRAQGYDVVEQNWKTKWCEIDIVAQKQDVTYFVEVKYRAKNSAGRGLDYITPQKQRQMKFAAEIWRSVHKAHNPCQLAAIELSGEDFAVTAFVDNIA